MSDDLFSLTAGFTECLFGSQRKCPVEVTRDHQAFEPH